MLKHDDYDSCPKCQGSFSFRKLRDGICPWCEKVIIPSRTSEPYSQRERDELVFKYYDLQREHININEVREIISRYESTIRRIEYFEGGF